ncbi:hypothetical protein IJG14_04605 [bacterium]|nr:hypothetical protein [bacterium]
MSMSINETNSAEVAASLYIATSTKIMTNLTEATKSKLVQYNIDVEKVNSEEEAQALINEKETEKIEKNNSSKNAETYYDKQIISDAINLAEDLGLYVDTSTDIETLMYNIQSRLTQLQNTLGDSENMKKIVDEYSNRYDYIYAQYMNKKEFLSTQIITSLDAMSIGSVSIGLS